MRAVSESRRHRAGLLNVAWRAPGARQPPAAPGGARRRRPDGGRRRTLCQLRWRKLGRKGHDSGANRYNVFQPSGSGRDCVTLQRGRSRQFRHARRQAHFGRPAPHDGGLTSGDLPHTTAGSLRATCPTRRRAHFGRPAPHDGGLTSGDLPRTTAGSLRGDLPRATARPPGHLRDLAGRARATSGTSLAGPGPPPGPRWPGPGHVRDLAGRARATSGTSLAGPGPRPGPRWSGPGRPHPVAATLRQPTPLSAHPRLEQYGLK
jgi:hypothetical protein